MSVSDDDKRLRLLLSNRLDKLSPPTSISNLKYDLNAGVPDSDSLPLEALRRVFDEVLSLNPKQALTYDTPNFGFEPLKEAVIEKIAETFRDIDSSWVSLVSGSAHGLDNIAAAFVDEGDVILVGAPTYPGAIRTFTARGAKLISVEQDEYGFSAAGLDAALTAGAASKLKIKAAYLIPNYDNPSSTLMPVERRKALIKVAKRHEILLIEDGAYAGIDLSGPPPPSLFQLAHGRGVIYCGTFSKTIATGLRSGYILASPAITKALKFMRFDNASSSLVQQAIHKFYTSDEYPDHLEKIQKIYRGRRDVVTEALDKYCKAFLNFSNPEGGFFHWLTLREGLSASEAREAAALQGVAISPGRGYYLANHLEQDSRVRIVFSALDEASLVDAIKLLGKSLEIISK
jgi:2-aminoadipate transaminase